MDSTIITIPSTGIKIVQKKPEISGSFTRSYLIDIFIAHSARSAFFSLSVPVSLMVNLNQSLKALLMISPMVPTLWTQIPFSWRVHRSGGKKEGIGLLCFTLTGMVALTTIYACTDITTIDRFDLRYMMMLTAGNFIGYGSSSSLLIMDALKWAPQKRWIPNLQMLNAFLVDLSSVTTPIVMYYLGTLGHVIPSSIYTGMVLSSGVIGLFFLNPSPYNQLKTRFSKERAKELAKESGQLPELIGKHDDLSLVEIFKENWPVLIDRRCILLSYSVLASLGSFFVLRTILPSTLINGFSLGQGEAIVTTSVANLLTILSRPLATKLIEYWDKKSGGVYVHLLGSGLAIVGCTTLAVIKLPRWVLYPSIATTCVGVGFNMVTPLSLANEWSKPREDTLPKVNPVPIFTIFSTLGSLGGIILPLLLGILVDQSGSKGYQTYFFTIMAMMFISALCVPIVDSQIKRTSIFNGPMTFFKNVLHPDAAQELVVSREQALGTQEREPEIYVEQIL